MNIQAVSYEVLYLMGALYMTEENIFALGLQIYIPKAP
jgi:hypothetical protein